MPFDPPAQPRDTLSPILPVQVDDVTYAVGGKALLDGLSLRLAAGTRTVMMGANGAGKSLTLRMLQGLIAPTRGRIVWNRKPGGASPGGRVALVFQRPVLLRRSVAANLAHALRIYGVPSAVRRRRTDELLELAHLEPLRDRPARVLSGGEQQRLSLIRALAAEPGLLLLDEPTANLDPRSTEAIEQLIAEAHRRGTAVVVVTHDIGQARRLGDEVVFLHCGRVAEQARADRFFHAPQSEAARAYLDGRLYL